MTAQPSETGAVEQFHDLAPDGRQKHYMVRQGPIFVCECGERRDRFGHSLPVLVKGG